MIAERTEENYRRYDWFKWGIILFLVFILSWLILQQCNNATVEAPTFNNLDTELIAGNAVKLTGTGPAGYDVQVRLNDELLDVVTVDADGMWELESAEFDQDGVYQVSLDVIDESGEVITSLAEPQEVVVISPVMVENESPDLTTIAPSILEPEITVGSPPSVLFQGTAAANSRVDVQVSGESAGIVDVNADGEWMLSTDRFNQAGRYSVEVFAIDGAGNLIGSAPAKVSFALATGDLVDQAPKVNAFEVRQNNSDNILVLYGEGIEETQVRVYRNGSELGVVDVADDGSWVWEGAVDMSTDSSEIVVETLDAAGVVLATSQPFSAILADFASNESSEEAVPETETMAETDEADMADDSEANMMDNEMAAAGNVITVTADTVTMTGDIALDTVDPDAEFAQRVYILTGNGKAGEEIAVLVDGTQVGTAIVDEDGVWVWQGTLADVEAGTYQLTTEVIGMAEVMDEEMADAEPAEAMAETTDADDADEAVDEEETETTDASSEAGEGIASSSGTLDLIPAVARANGNFSTFIELARSVAFAPALETDGPYTVFAPTDAAFAKLPVEVVHGLTLHPEVLQRILLHHVVNGQFDAPQVIEAGELTSALDTSLRISQSAGAVFVDRAMVTEPNVIAGNGIIHGIDYLLLPPSGTIFPIIDSSGVAEFSGDFLTVTGTSEPGTKIFLAVNGVFFGETVVQGDGTWQVSGAVEDGEYEIVAYSCTWDEVLLEISESVFLTVSN